MIRVGVIFELRRARTVPGESICVCGNVPALGAWAPDSEATAHQLEMKTGPRMAPRWSMLRPVWLEVPHDRQRKALSVEYKFVRDRRLLMHNPGPGLQWEDSIQNRAASLPCEDGSIWIVSDASWDHAAEPPKVTRTSTQQVISRWACLDEEWAALQRPARKGVEPSCFLLTPRASAHGARLHGEDSCPLGFPIEEEFDALSPEDKRFRAGPKGPVPPVRLSFLPRTDEEAAAPPVADAQLQEALARMDRLASENEMLRKRIELLTAAARPADSKAGGLHADPLLQEPDVEPQSEVDDSIHEIPCAD